MITSHDYTVAARIFNKMTSAQREDVLLGAGFSLSYAVELSKHMGFGHLDGHEQIAIIDYFKHQVKAKIAKAISPDYAEFIQGYGEM